MQKYEFDTSAMMRRVIQAAHDLATGPMSKMRVLDLGCAHGHYAFQMANLGAQVVGIEGRESWLEQARLAKQEAALTNVDFVQDDVRNLSKKKYGEFNIILCLGLLYHLNEPDLFDFLNNMYEVCQDFTIIETHFATRPTHNVTWRGKQYWGTYIQEHEAGTEAKEKLKKVGASLDNETSFWLSKASLFNILQHVGFSSVYECHIPLGNLYVEPERKFKIWGSRTMLVAKKGRLISLDDSEQVPADWPENFEKFLMEHHLHKQQSPMAAELKGMIIRFLGRFVPRY